ncbi:MAG TPA: VOC family protein [Firmicutes bacterium]|nr:VOC family protein [Bacillota bacterium]
MIQSGTVYVIAQDFEGTLEFYRKLLERDVAAQNKTRFAIFRIGGLELSVMNAYFDVQHPEEVSVKGRVYPVYDDLVQIANSENPGKIVINLWTDDLKAEHRRIQDLGIGSELTEIRYINAKTPYWYFCLRDPDGNTIEIAGCYEECMDEPAAE